jgi:glutathione S-transferase
MSIKVHYFDVRGKAEVLRMILTHAKVPFEDIRHTREEFATMKGELEFGQLPSVEIDGKHYSQTNAIVRMLGIKYGFYSTDADECWKIDSTLDAMNDLTPKFYPVIMGENEEAKKKAGEELFSGFLPMWMGVIEARLAKNGCEGHIVGDRMTIADFALASLLLTLRNNEASPMSMSLGPFFEKFPKISAYCDSLTKEMDAYLKARKPQVF